jgi:hypothetical protein
MTDISEDTVVNPTPARRTTKGGRGVENNKKKL